MEKSPVKNCGRVSPKGLYDVYAQVRENEQQYEEEQPSLAFLNIAWFFGIISIALGFSNLLPIPALDGGASAIHSAGNHFRQTRSAKI